MHPQGYKWRPTWLSQGQKGWARSPTHSATACMVSTLGPGCTQEAGHMCRGIWPPAALPLG